MQYGHENTSRDDVAPSCAHTVMLSHTVILDHAGKLRAWNAIVHGLQKHPPPCTPHSKNPYMNHPGTGGWQNETTECGVCFSNYQVVVFFSDYQVVSVYDAQKMKTQPIERTSKHTVNTKLFLGSAHWAYAH